MGFASPEGLGHLFQWSQYVISRSLSKWATRAFCSVFCPPFWLQLSFFYWHHNGSFSSGYHDVSISDGCGMAQWHCQGDLSPSVAGWCGDIVAMLLHNWCVSAMLPQRLAEWLLSLLYFLVFAIKLFTYWLFQLSHHDVTPVQTHSQHGFPLPHPHKEFPQIWHINIYVPSTLHN